MRNLITIAIALIVSFASYADIGTLESMDVSTSQVGINFEDNDETIVLTFSEDIKDKVHSIIKIERINDLEYKTRVMRYFGGLLKTQSFDFKNLVIVVEGERLKYEWSRENVSTIVNKMVRLAETMI